MPDPSFCSESTACFASDTCSHWIWKSCLQVKQVTALSSNFKSTSHFPHDLLVWLQLILGTPLIGPFTLLQPSVLFSWNSHTEILIPWVKLDAGWSSLLFSLFHLPVSATCLVFFFCGGTSKKVELAGSGVGFCLLGTSNRALSLFVYTVAATSKVVIHTQTVDVKRQAGCIWSR